MGALPKSTRELKITGAYRKDRHGDRCDPELTPGQPVRPKWLRAREAKELWDRVVPSLCKAGIATQEDGDALASMCRWYGEWRRADRTLQRAEGLDDRDKAVNVARKTWNECFALMRRFGLTPADRAALKVGKLDDRSAKEIKYFG